MLSLIVAMDKNNVIGKDNDMPWHLPNDLKHFKETTLGHTMIMGRKTFDSIGRVLPGRKTVVLTRSEQTFPEEVDVIHSIEEIQTLQKANEEDELFVIGGGELFKEMLPHADKLYVTVIDEAFDGDVYFPEIDPRIWDEVSKEKGLKDEKNIYDYYFIEYSRKK
ncbi:MAG TPA: dihydrofolate reductase [Pseudogracilibacillus sp.]|nr:dihydrofolate reductase [Pseudogracilibacillus sp.]